MIFFKNYKKVLTAILLILLSAGQSYAFNIEKEANIDDVAIDGDYKGYTRLQIACMNCDVSIVKLLLENGAKVNGICRYCETPLHIACFSRNKEVVKLLLENNANVNAVIKTSNMFVGFMGWTPLHVACGRGNVDIVELLLEYNADINFIDSFAKTPLQLACSMDNANIVELLLENCANPDATTTFHSETPSQLATSDAIKYMVNLVSDYLKEAQKGKFYRDTFAMKIDKNKGFLEKIRKAYWIKGNKQMEQTSLKKYIVKEDCMVIV